MERMEEEKRFLEKADGSRMPQRGKVGRTQGRIGCRDVH